jgi:GDP-L-fucose synthase
MNKDSRIYVAGHRGLVGSAIVRELKKQGFKDIITACKESVDLRLYDQVRDFFNDYKPDYVFLAAAKVGGIMANNSMPVEFLQDNIEIQTNVIQCAKWTKTKKLMFLGSSCIYPRMAPQPIKEEYLMTGPLEPTNEWYAVAKIAGIKLCQAYRKQHGCDFISVMPTNLYGPGDNYDLNNSHVIPGLIRRFHEAKESGADSVTLWGSGSPRREFFYVDDLARACVFLMENYSHEQIINIGSGTDITIRELAEMIRIVVGFQGEIKWDTSKPDGTPRKLMDSSRIQAMGWAPEYFFEAGLLMAYADFVERHKQAGKIPLPI